MAWRRCVLVWLGLQIAGCGSVDRDECVPAAEHRRLPIGPPGVTLLFVIDGSATMAEEQAALAVEVPRMVRALATGDVDADGMVDFEPPGSVKVGVVSADMGSGGHPLAAVSSTAT